VRRGALVNSMTAALLVVHKGQLAGSTVSVSSSSIRGGGGAHSDGMRRVFDYIEKLG